MSLNEQAILDALRVIKDPDLHQDIVSLGFIKNLAIENGKVRFDIELTTPACPVKDQFKTQAEAEVKKLSGVSAVEVKMTSNVRQASTGIQNLNMPSVKNLIAVASGKGGVGKSTVSANLALALAKTGAKVGLMDADVYGPSIPRMLGVMGQQPATDPLTKKMVPFEKHGIKFMSVGMLQADSDTALIWRGPMASKLIQQFLGGVEWGELDYLLIDLPPGTGDIQLTLTQSAPLAGAVIVTTPQDVARTITQKGLRMFQQVQVPIIGIVENMSGFVCEHCHEVTPIFKKGGGKKMAEEVVVPFLGELPLEPTIAADGDYGVPTVAAHPDSPSGKAYALIARQMASQLSIINEATGKVSNRPREVDTKDPQVTTITWDDGSLMRYPNRYLRSMCPCAQCVNEVTGERMINLASIDPAVRIVGVAPVGRYALHFQWSDGHGTGLYSFETLRKLGE
ncbi:MAG TPA: iron-sulfur cluster carrier protein ApbC [bacterium]|nr:iron-sulfur cluster carrier protein ApbC [bacterium]